MGAPFLFRKRSGEIVDYNEQKIAGAVYAAAQSVGGGNRKRAEKIAAQVTRYFTEHISSEIANIETIQDLVEKVLIENGHARTAKSYILYREKRTHARHMSAAWDSAVQSIDIYMEKNDWRVRENANMGFSLQGLNNFITNKVSSQYWLDRIYPETISHAHVNGDIHIHDLGSIAPYCCGWDLQELLRIGFKGVYGKVASGPPFHFSTALNQIINFFYTLQGEAAGAQAFSNFDTLLAPFIRHDGLSYKDVKQIMQQFIFNLNIPTRVGFQTPFTNLTMDLRPSSYLADQPICIGGKVGDTTYKEYYAEQVMLNKAFCEIMLEGDGDGRPFSFPIPTYNITEDFPWDDPNLDSLWKMTGKYGTPYFANYIGSDLSPDDARSMCCRLRLDNRELRRRGGGLFGASPMTGSIGVLTINLPRIGMLTKTEDEFIARLDGLMEYAKNALTIKRKVLESFSERGLYPYSKFYLKSVYDKSKHYWNNHFSTIGLIGMHEACINHIKEGIDSTAGFKFALRIMKFMREKITEFQEQTGNLYNLEATPAEGTSHRLALLDRELFGEQCFISGDSAHPYYTNSTHLPVDSTSDIFAALSHQQHLQNQYTGGTVFHGFIGEEITDQTVVQKLVKRIAETFPIPYFTLTPTYTICPVHGYITGEHHSCPRTIA